MNMALGLADLHCGYCLRTPREAGLEFRVCGACHRELYCSIECESSDWSTHECECKDDYGALKALATLSDSAKARLTTENGAIWACSEAFEAAGKTDPKYHYKLGFLTREIVDRVFAEDVRLYEDAVSLDQESVIVKSIEADVGHDPLLQPDEEHVAIGANFGKGMARPIPEFYRTILEGLTRQCSLERDLTALKIVKYTEGKGIGLHRDDGYYPFAAILSLVNPAKMIFARPLLLGGRVMRVVTLPPRSLFVFKDRAFDSLCHGIPEQRGGVRYALVWRDHIDGDSKRRRR